MNYEAEMYVWLGDDKRVQAKALLKVPYDTSEDVVKAKHDEADRLNNEARVFYDKAVALAPDSTLARVRLGYLLKSMAGGREDMLRLAIRQFDAALALEPDFMASYYRGDAYSKLRDQASALRDFTAAVEAEPCFKEGLLARSAIYQIRGRVEEAKADCQRVLELTAQVKEHQDWKKALQDRIQEVRSTAKSQNRSLSPAEEKYVKELEQKLAEANQIIKGDPEYERDAVRQAMNRLRNLQQASAQ